MDVWPLSFVALAPLIVALRGLTPKRAAWVGWVAGFVSCAIGFYWLLEMLKTFSGFPTPLCFVFTMILAGYQAGRLSLLGLLTSLSERRGYSPGLSFSLAFVASETLYPLLFPWTFGAAVHQVPALVQVGEVAGPITIALTLVAPNWALAELWLWWRKRRTGDREPLPWRKLAVLGAIPLISTVYGAIRISQVDAAVLDAEKLRVGLVQANMGLMEKRQNRDEGLRRHIRMTRKLVRDEGIGLVVWSETSVAGATREKDAKKAYARTVGRRLGVPGIFGAVLVRPVDDARKYVLFNSALMSDKKGNVVGRYDKQFLLAFGEYLPFGETFPKLYEWSPNSGHFTPGTSLEPLKLGEHEVATFICYEDIVPSFVNSIMKHGNPELLVNITNDAWFGDTLEPWQHMALAKLRAVEQRRFFIRSTNSGVSGVVDPVGRLMSHTRTFERATLAEDVAWMNLSTPYQIWGDLPWWLLSALCLGLGLSPWGRRRPNGVDGTS